MPLHYIAKCLVQSIFIIIVIDNTDFVAMDPIRVINTTEVSLLTFDDDITLEYDDTVTLTFTSDDPGLISSLETAGEYIRDTTTVNIIDNDCKPIKLKCI